jgi:hypothetical protein
VTTPQQDKWSPFEQRQPPQHSGLRGEVEKHPLLASSAAVASVPVGVRTHGDVQALRTLSRLKDTERGAKLVGDLAGHRSMELPNEPREMGFRDYMLGQKRVHRGAKAQNADVGALRPTVNRYSRTFDQAKKIKQAGKNPVEGVGGVLAHPVRAERGLHARVLGGLVDAAEHGNHPELLRSQHNVTRHAVGDTVDFGRFSSFTADKEVAQRTGEVHEQTKFMPTSAVPAGSKPVTYHLPAGQGQAANLSGATNRFAQNEWMVGGKYKVDRVQGSHVYLKTHPDTSLGKRWEKQGSGWTKKGAPPGKGGHVEDPGQYEAIKRRTGNKRMAAAVSNTPHQVHRKDIFKAAVYSAGSQGAIAQEHANERARSRAHAVSSLAAANAIATGTYLGHEKLKGRSVAREAGAVARRRKQLTSIRHGGIAGTAAALGATAAYTGAARHHHKEAAAAARNVESLKKNPPPIFGKRNGFGVDEELVKAYQAPLAKAFDPERQRHRRQNLYEGAAAGGSVAAGAGAGVLGRRARSRARDASTWRGAAEANRGYVARDVEQIAGNKPKTYRRADVMSHYGRLGQAVKTSQLAVSQEGRAATLAREARGLGHGAAAAGAASAGLAAGAIGVHRHNKGHGRSYHPYAYQ